MRAGDGAAVSTTPAKQADDLIWDSTIALIRELGVARAAPAEACITLTPEQMGHLRAIVDAWNVGRHGARLPPLGLDEALGIALRGAREFLGV